MVELTNIVSKAEIHITLLIVRRGTQNSLFLRYHNPWQSSVSACEIAELEMLCPRTSTDQKKKHQYIGTIGSFRLWCTSPCCCRTLSPFPSRTAAAPNIGPFSDRRRRNPRCSLLQFTGGSCWRWWASLLFFSGCHSRRHFSCTSFSLPRSDWKQKHANYL